MSNQEIHFSDDEFEQWYAGRLGGLSEKLNTLANDTLRQTYGKKYLPNPSDIELTPTATMDGTAVVMRAWHQTAGERPAVFQSADTSFFLNVVHEHAYIATERNVAYRLTTREALLLQEISSHAVLHSLSPNATDY